MRATAYSYLRFSTKGQCDSDSLRRQLDASRRYAAERGWHFDDSLRDLGVSAFRGKNRQVGALSRFLQLVDEGRVRPGSWLILEAIDRLSREEVSKALTLFLKIIGSGVGIVTLIDRREYTEKSINENPFELMYSIALMAAANEYSRKLSLRVREAKDAALRDLKAGRRAVIHGKPPYWCVYDRESNAYKLHPERAAIVREAVRLTMEGVGTLRIAKKFTEKGYKTHHGKSEWLDTSLGHILRSRCLVGEYTPKRVEAGRRVGTKGDPIPNYYPALLSHDEFYSLQSRLEERKQKIRGRRGSGFMFNLFNRLLVCGHDNTRMVVVARRNQSNAKDGGKGKLYKSLANDDWSRSFPYEPLVNAFLDFVVEVRLRKPVGTQPDHVDVWSGQLAERKTRMTKLQEFLTSGDVSQLGAVVQAVAELQKEMNELSHRIESERARRHQQATTPADVADLRRLLKKAPEDEKLDLLHRLRLAIADVVKEAKVWIAGNTVKRCAVMVVTLRDGQQRVLAVRCERGREALAVADPQKFSAWKWEWAASFAPALATIMLGKRTQDEMLKAWDEMYSMHAKFEPIVPPMRGRKAVGARS